MENDLKSSLEKLTDIAETNIQLFMKMLDITLEQKRYILDGDIDSLQECIIKKQEYIDQLNALDIRQNFERLKEIMQDNSDLNLAYQWRLLDEKMKNLSRLARQLEEMDKSNIELAYARLKNLKTGIQTVKDHKKAVYLYNAESMPEQKISFDRKK
mgnify:CR=1 FL=1